MTLEAEFKVLELAPDDGTSSGRHQRRAYLSPEALRTHKLVAGDWALVQAQEPYHGAVQLWPRVGLEDDSGLHCRDS